MYSKENASSSLKRVAHSIARKQMSERSRNQNMSGDESEESHTNYYQRGNRSGPNRFRSQSRSGATGRSQNMSGDESEESHTNYYQRGNHSGPNRFRSQSRSGAAGRSQSRSRAAESHPSNSHKGNHSGPNRFRSQSRSRDAECPPSNSHKGNQDESKRTPNVAVTELKEMLKQRPKLGESLTFVLKREYICTYGKRCNGRGGQGCIFIHYSDFLGKMYRVCKHPTNCKILDCDRLHGCRTVQQQGKTECEKSDEAKKEEEEEDEISNCF